MLESVTVYFDLTCPVCNSSFCLHGADCHFFPNCRDCHETDHDTENGNILVKFLKNDYTTNGFFSSPANLIIAGLSSDEEIQAIVLDHILNFSNLAPTTKRDPGEDRKYIDAIVFVSIRICDEEELLNNLEVNYPDSFFWRRSKGLRLIQDAQEIVEKISISPTTLDSHAPVTSVHDYSHQLKGIIDQLIALNIDIIHAKKTIRILSNGYLQYGIREQLQFLSSKSVLKELHPFYPGIISWMAKQWFHEASIEISKNPLYVHHIDLEEFEYAERILAESGNYTDAFIICTLILKKAHSGLIDEVLLDLFSRGLSYLEYWEEFSNFVSWLEIIVESGLPIEVSFPDWLPQKMVKSPEHIPKFDGLCKSLGVVFDYTQTINFFPKDSFAKFLCYNHLRKIIGEENGYGTLDQCDYSGRLVSGDHPHLPENTDLTSGLVPLRGFTLDLPNLLWIAHRRSGNENHRFDSDLGWKAIEALVFWINQCTVPCYVHTTPSLCQKGGDFVNHIFEHSNATFIQHQWEPGLDEDLFFLFFSITRGTWIISRDSFKSHSSVIQRLINGRVFTPNYCHDNDEIIFDLPPM